MNWLSRLVPGTRGELSSQLSGRLDAWKTLPEADIGQTHFETRYVVVNTEATGLDLDSDRLLAVAAIALSNCSLSPGDTLYEQLAEAPAEALLKLLEFSGKSPWVSFNASFNRTLIERAFQQHLGITPEMHWVDLQWLLPALYPEHHSGRERLGTWMDAFGIETFQRHHGLGDAYAIAQLLMAALGRSHVQGSISPRQLVELEHNQRRSRDAL